VKLNPKEFQALQDRFAIGRMTGDGALCASVYAPDARVAAPDGRVIRGQRHIRDYWQQDLDEGAGSNGIAMEELRQIGENVVIEYGLWARFVERVAVGPPVDRGFYVIRHERQPDGRWLWASDTFVSRSAASPLMRR
jgi:ketosteroid isomerase-like protein